MNPNGVPVYDGSSTATIGGNVQPGNNTGVTTPGGDCVVTPGSVTNSQGDRDPKITGAGDAMTLFDSNGNPLPVDQLPTLAQCETPGPQIIRRLNAAQYHNTLVRVFGEGVPDSTPLQDVTTLGYNVDADDSLVDGLKAEALNTLSEDVAQYAKDNNLIAQFSNNCSNAADKNCRDTFVKNLGQALSREPLDQARVDRFSELFNAVADYGTQLATTFEDGAMLVIQGMVQSPYMVYRREIGTQQNGTYQLSPYEVASELSYMLTNNPPDQELMQAAANGQLASTDQILSQSQRLLATGDAAGVLEGFVTAWLDLDRLKGKAKAGDELTDSLRTSMLEESRRLFLDVFQNDGTIGDLFSATYTYMNQ